MPRYSNTKQYNTASSPLFWIGKKACMLKCQPKYATAIMPLEINAARPAKRPIIIITPPISSMPPPIAITAESSPPPDADGGNPSSFCVPCHMNKNPVTILMTAYT